MAVKTRLNIVEHLDRLEELSETIDLIDGKRISLFIVEQKIKNLQKDKKGIEAEIEKLQLKEVELNNVFKGKTFRSTADQPGLFDVVAGKEGEQAVIALSTERAEVSFPAIFYMLDDPDKVKLTYRGYEIIVSLEGIVSTVLRQNVEDFETMKQVNNAGLICLEGSSAEQLVSIFLDFFTQNHRASTLGDGLTRLSLAGGSKDIEDDDASILGAFNEAVNPVDIFIIYDQSTENQSVKNVKAFAAKLPEEGEAADGEPGLADLPSDNNNNPVETEKSPITFTVEEQDNEGVVLRGHFNDDGSRERKVSRLITKSFLKKFELISLIEASHKQLLEVWDDPAVNFTDLDNIEKPKKPITRLKKSKQAIPYSEVEV